MNYVITGATSFIGIHLIDRLLQEGQYVYALCRPNSKKIVQIPHGKNIKIVLYNDINDIDSVTSKIENADVFIHLAWKGIRGLSCNDRTMQQENIKDSRKVIDAASKLGCKLFVFAGSQAEFGLQKYPFTSDTLGSPNTEYGKAKLEFAMYASEFSIDHQMKFLHLRIVSLYGEGDWEDTLIMGCLRKMLNHEEVRLRDSCTQMWNYLYVKDAATQISRLCRYALDDNGFESERYLIASNDTRILKEFVEEMKEITNSGNLVIYGEKESNVVLQPDITKTQKDTNGFIADYKFGEGIRNVIKYLNENK